MVNSKKPRRNYTHQKRWTLLRPESPTSELLLGPDAVFPSVRAKKHRFFVFSAVLSWLGVAYIRWYVVANMATPVLKLYRTAVWFFGWRTQPCEYRWSLRADLSSLPACWRCHHGCVIKPPVGKQRHLTLHARKTRMPSKVSPRCPLVEKMLEPCTPKALNTKTIYCMFTWLNYLNSKHHFCIQSPDSHHDVQFSNMT